MNWSFHKSVRLSLFQAQSPYFEDLGENFVILVTPDHLSIIPLADHLYSAFYFLVERAVPSIEFTPLRIILYTLRAIGLVKYKTLHVNNMAKIMKNDAPLWSLMSQISGIAFSE